MLESSAAGYRDQAARASGADRETALLALGAAERHLGVARAKLEALGAAAH
jgi:hypothetical protein